MSSTFRIDYIEAALLALLNMDLAAAYGAKVSIDSLGDDDFDDQGRLVLSPPAVRVRFLHSSDNPARDNQRLTYQTPLSFEILCFESGLRSSADERKQTLIIVAAVRDVLAGTRLQLSDGSKTMPITLNGVDLVDTSGGPVDQLFSVGIIIEGIAQFSGANANPNGGN